MSLADSKFGSSRRRSQSASPASPNTKELAGDTAITTPLSRAERKKRRREISQTYWAREQDDCSSVPLADRMAAISQHGNFSLAYSLAVQPSLMHIGDRDALIAHRSRWGMTFALGDPVCDPSATDALLRSFLDQTGRPSFCQVSASTAEKLSALGYIVNEMGVDTRIDLAEYDFRGKSKEWLRYASNWTARRGYKVIEASFDEIDAGVVESVSEAWRKTRTVKRKEVRFLNRPIVLEDEPYVRKFYLLDESERILAFIYLDPMFEAGEVTGYVTSIKRRLPDAPVYAEQSIMKAIIEILQAEQINTLRLGLSPCAWIEPSPFRESRFRRWMFQRAYNSKWLNRYAYNMVGHANYKRRFRGTEEKLYFATPPGFRPRQMAALIALCGIA